MLKRSLLIVGLASSCLLASSFATAGGGSMVFDPTNFMENIETAMATVETESQGIEAAIREAQMLENSIKNTANTVSDLSGIGAITNDIASLQQQWNLDKTLMTQLGGQDNFVNSVMSQYSASSSNGSFNDYVTVLATKAQQGQQNATSLFANYQNMASELQKTISQRQAIALKNTGALGTNDAIQITNAQLDNLAEINQATLQGIQTLVRQAAYQQAAQSAPDKGGSVSLDQYYKAKANDGQAYLDSVPPTNTIVGY
jgi:P-type conjugative transfer protein TrbJ